MEVGRVDGRVEMEGMDGGEVIQKWGKGKDEGRKEEETRNGGRIREGMGRNKEGRKVRH